MDRALLGSDFFQTTYSPERELQTTSELVKSPQVASAVAASIGERLGTKNPLAMLSVNINAKVDILKITITDSNPQLAADVANSFATEFINWRRGVDQEVLHNAQLPLEAQLLGMSPEQQETTKNKAIRDKLETLKLLETMQTGNLEIVKPAVAPPTPFSPKPLRTSLFAFIASLTLGVGMIFVAEHLDTKVRTADEITNVLQRPILASVPKFSASSKGSLETITNPSGASSESFRLLKTNIGYIEPDREIRTIMVTSAQAREGKTTTIANLAVTMARAGQRVIILDGDMRRPKVHEYMKLDNSIGLTNVIAGTFTLRESLQEVEAQDLAVSSGYENTIAGFEPTSMNGIKPIYCATVGPLPPNPGEIISSDKFSSLIDEARKYADIVLIDAPPLGAVGDAASMASKVDGVIIIVRMAETSKKSLGLINHFIKTVPTCVMGVVVTNASADKSGYGYKYSYNYGESNSIE